MTIELLESRIAPAAVVTYFEADGDKIKVVTSKGTSAELKTALDLGADPTPADAGIDFSRLGDPDIFQGTNITVSVVKKGGDGAANLLYIDAYDPDAANQLDLGKVMVRGSLGFIDAGDADTSTKAIKSLIVDTMRGDTSGGTPDRSDLNGNVGSILVKGDFHGYLQQTTLGATIGKLVIKGSVGGDEVFANNGRIDVNFIGSLTVAGTVFGGQIASDSPDYSGSITAKEIGTLSVGHVVAGVGTHSGTIDITGTQAVN